MFLQTFIVILFRVLQFAILLRVILSWVNPGVQFYRGPILNIVWQITEPILAPIRRFATFGMVDFSPIAALILLQVLESLLLQVITGAV